MNEKELLSQLNNLKNIKPDGDWKRASREILLSQISGGYYDAEKTELKKENFVFSLKHLFAQPAFITITILAVVLGGGVLSLNVSRNTKPGDSLYIAKIISEKARATFTFNDEDKAKLGLEFAGERAKEMSQVLAGSNDDEKKAEKVEKLANNIKKEISNVKMRLQNMGVAKQEKTEPGEEEGVFSADFGKDENGVQVYDSKADIQNDAIKNDETTTSLKNDSASTSLSTGASTSLNVGTSTVPSADASAALNAGSIEKALNEAENLLENKDYNGTLDQLEKADQIVSQIDKSGSAGESGTGSDGAATSTK